MAQAWVNTCCLYGAFDERGMEERRDAGKEERTERRTGAQSGNLLLRTCELGRLTQLIRLLPPTATAAFAAEANDAALVTFAKFVGRDALSPG